MKTKAAKISIGSIIESCNLNLNSKEKSGQEISGDNEKVIHEDTAISNKKVAKPKWAKYLAGICAILFLSSCGRPNHDSFVKEIELGTKITVYEYVIEECHYLGNLDFTGNPYLTHKGNCPSDIHKNK
jgi:hypothetical protein